MVRPSKNWERLVRATLRREKLRHDGRGGHERAPIGIASSVPPSLTRETNIDLILPAADEIQSEDPNVSRIRLVSLEILQLCHPKRLGFSAFVSRRPSPLDTTQLWISWVTMNAFESSLSPLSYTFTKNHNSHASPIPVTVVKKTPQSESSVNNEHPQCYECLRDEVTELVWFLKSTTIGNKLLNDALEHNPAFDLLRQCDLMVELKWMKQENAT
ncbi:hypothetical protein RHSIM_Rhsim06G0129700 [Rhododendron simsii]|uniref:Uncharacterized protein n=1 Tax=Rhododendron simsii TaxID=118357 RepID=A0A834LKT4_RHOSS|nr:hypothetical protein RHSIM_Rhsim06G0129700 [Rhododendron simsii]